MKRRTIAGMVLMVLASVVLAEEITSPQNFKNDVNFDAGCVWKINNTRVTATAAQLNAAASGNIDVSRITNAAGSLGPSIGGNIPVAAITNAAGTLGPSIGGNIPVAAISNAMAGGSYSVPAASINSGNIAAARLTNALNMICVGLSITASATSDTNVTISVQAKDFTGANMTNAVGFRYWWSTTAAQTTPSTNGIESFSVTQGAVREYDLWNAGTNPVYTAQANTSGLFTLTAVSEAVTWTNQFHVLGPNGYYENKTVVWDAP